MSDPVVLAVVALVAIAVGFGIGFVARSFWASQTIRASQDKAGRIVAEARAQQKDLILQAKDEQVKLARQADDEARAKRQEVSNLERRVLQTQRRDPEREGPRGPGQVSSEATERAGTRRGFRMGPPDVGHVLAGQAHYEVGLRDVGVAELGAAMARRGHVEAGQGLACSPAHGHSFDDVRAGGGDLDVVEVRG